MHDLDQLVADEARRLQPTHAPAFAELNDRRRNRETRRKLATGAAAAFAVLGGLGIVQAAGESDRLEDAGRAFGHGSGERAYFALQYRDPREYKPESATGEVRRCLDSVADSRIDNTTRTLVPLYTLSVGRDNEAHFEACIMRIQNAQVSGPEISKTTIAATKELYSVYYLNINDYETAGDSALAACVSRAGGVYETVAYSIPPIPTVSLTALPGEQSAFLGCLRRLDNVRVEQDDPTGR